MLADPPTGCLYRAVGNTMVINRNQTGYGWFVDSTPTTNGEFAAVQGSQQLNAVSPDAMNRMDLLTVVEHELGHVARLDDLAADQTSLMGGYLAAGRRRLIGETELDALAADRALL
jgi:large repetitive protein